MQIHLWWNRDLRLKVENVSSFVLSYKKSMMVNFMYQSDWAIVPRYVAKCYSGCFCEDLLNEINI